MGRNKISITPISNERARQSTFAKRKKGLFKKAMELSILCGVEVTLLVTTKTNRLYEYSTSDPRQVLEKYDTYEKAVHSYSNANYDQFSSKKPKISVKQRSPHTESDYSQSPESSPVQSTPAFSPGSSSESIQIPPAFQNLTDASNPGSSLILDELGESLDASNLDFLWSGQNDHDLDYFFSEVNRNQTLPQSQQATMPYPECVPMTFVPNYVFQEPIYGPAHTGQMFYGIPYSGPLLGKRQAPDWRAY